ncbi:MAG: malate synthase G [Rhizobiales bacterium]|nr:malate synthase G [Hyphomicrobiales bacterium]NRB14544.1 malate synthase G [Hyphomicrobiales bacterium]
MTDRIQLGALAIDANLYEFIGQQVTPNSGIDAGHFWRGLDTALTTLLPKNKALLAKRETLQQQQDEWHKANPGPITDSQAYLDFLEKIGYLTPLDDDFKIEISHIDEEIATLAGPQLVVPINNARYALNAANARWGSLYDALYGTNVLADKSEVSTTGYDAAHGAKAIAWGRNFLNQHFALKDGSYTEATALTIENGQLIVTSQNGKTSLAQANKYIGHQGSEASPTGIVLKNNGLHIIIKINRDNQIGSTDSAGIADIMVESALSTIMDCEDSVAAVNAAEKIAVYSNWLGLMQSDLSINMVKGGKTITRKLNADIEYTDIKGQAATLKGRSLMLIRNVGHLMTSDAILHNGSEIPEGIMDAFVTALIALHNLNPNHSGFKNSQHGSVYIVKPKMHGPEEVAFADEIFLSVENLLGLAPNTLKIGIMDEERRTSANLKQCIRAVKNRVFFINTGFLDRTGDEIHSIMQAGPVVTKGAMKSSNWIKTYEQRNVQIGLDCGFKGQAQIGKGMWAMPDEMADMMAQKIGHPNAGASTAWVPSPTAATLHATHYHQVNVAEVQTAIDGDLPPLKDLLNIPIVGKNSLSQAEIEHDLAMSAQSILGYVVRWIDQGIGCSKVPDINDIGLMEDRATLRISSQHIANWLLHEVCSEAQVMQIMQDMAAKVDGQNAGDAAYINMSPNFDNSLAFTASCALIFEGINQPSGYTEPILHAKRYALLKSGQA